MSTATLSLIPRWHAPACHHWGVRPIEGAPVEGDDTNMGYEYGRGAEMLIARTRLGFTREEMTAAMKVRPQSYQRWENGKDAIPSGVWDEVAKLHTMFAQRVTELVTAAAKVDGPYIVTVWRGASDHQPSPGLWLHIVSEAMKQAPNIVPRYPEDREP